jgi:aspartate aminotransferase
VVAIAPYFPEYKVFVENAGAKFVTTTACEPDFSINFESLDEVIDENVRAIIINSPNNPSGAVYSEREIIKLANLLKEKQAKFNKPIYVISDEPYREIVFDDFDCPYIPKYYDNTIVCYSYSKSLSLPGERIGYIALSPNAEYSKDLYFAICGAGRSQGYVCAPSLFQKVIEKNAGKSSDITLYKENLKILVNELKSLGFVCNEPKGAFYLMLKSPDGDGKSLSEKAKKLGLLLVPSNSFGVLGYVRIATCVPKDRVIRSIPAFKRLAQEYKLI